MVGTPYFRGRSREYRTMGALRVAGWRCSRSAMSHGPVDIFAGKNGRILLIQVKSGKARMGRQEREKLIEWTKAFGAEAEIWYYSRKKGNTIEKVTW